LRMYVIDENGNFDFCEVTLILQDSPLTNACQDVASLLPSVSGRITTEMSDGVNNIEVELTNMTSALNKTEMTNNDGQYKFDGIDVFDPKTIEARNEADLLNGVSTLDLVMMQRHILGLQSIASPYKLLAADVNNSKSITASDLVDLRKVILGMSTSFVNNTSWRFVPSDFVFQDPTYPYDFPSMINLDSLFEDKTNVNFIGVKVGDINNWPFRDGERKIEILCKRCRCCGKNRCQTSGGCLPRRLQDAGQGRQGCARRGTACQGAARQAVRRRSLHGLERHGGAGNGPARSEAA